WSTTFLPTLYSRLGCASNPFVLDADMVKVIQDIIDLVYPDTDYQVRTNDRIFAMKRSFFGRQGIKIVAEFFKDEAYANKPKAIAKYTLWATRGDGPALFGIPTPINCNLNKGDDRYIEPDDIFESKFIIQLLTPFLKSCKGSCQNHGCPVGALALAATAVS
ncbi:hypothetical protein BJV78DRAFT_1092706, partial [Lactifluus subvellereus]